MFKQTKRSFGAFHSFSELDRIPNFIHGFTDRKRGIEDLHLSEEWNLDLMGRLGVARSRIGLLHQVHSNDVLVVKSASQWVSWPGRLGTADGVITRLPGTFPIIRTADCVPVVAVDARTRSVGLIHAGWRGLEKRIAARSLSLLLKESRTASDEVILAIGPAIRKCCYEVGDDVVEALELAGHEVQRVFDGRNLDLVEMVRIQAEAAGVRRVVDSGVCCACCNERFYSYRKERTALRTWTFAGFLEAPRSD